MFSLRILGIDWLIFRHQHWQIGSRANLLHRRCSSKAVALEKRERRLVFRPDSSAFKDEFSSSRWLRSLELKRRDVFFAPTLTSPPSGRADGDWRHRRPIANFRLFFNLGWSIFSTVQVFIKFTGKGQLIMLMTFVKLTFRVSNIYKLLNYTNVSYIEIKTKKWLDGVCDTRFRLSQSFPISLWSNASKLRFLWANICWYVKLCRMRRFKEVLNTVIYRKCFTSGFRYAMFGWTLFI